MRWLGLGLAAVLSAAGMAAAGAGSAATAATTAKAATAATTAKAATAATAATPPTLDLKVLLIGSGSTDPTTAAWEAALSSEGVPYTEVTAAGAVGA